MLDAVECCELRIAEGHADAHADVSPAWPSREILFVPK